MHLELRWAALHGDRILKATIDKLITKSKRSQNNKAYLHLLSNECIQHFTPRVRLKDEAEIDKNIKGDLVEAYIYFLHKNFGNDMVKRYIERNILEYYKNNFV